MSDVAWPVPGPGTWMQDRAHLPVSTTALLQELFPSGFDRGFSATFEEFGALFDTMQQRFVNGFPFMQPLPFDAPGPHGPRTPEYLGEQIGKRAQASAVAFETKVWRRVLEAWDGDIKPKAIARHRELAGVDLASLDDEALRQQLHIRMQHVSEMMAQHHRHNGAALVPVGDWVLHAAQWTGLPPVPMFIAFDGWSPVTSVVPPELAPGIAALRADEDAIAILKGEGSDADVVAALRARVPAIDEWLSGVQFRIAAGFDLTNPTIGERPDLIRGRLLSAIEHEQEHALERSEAVANELRAAVPDEHKGEFDELLAEARLVYRLRDERGIYSDSAATGLLRLGLIEMGRRLFERGRINFTYDTLDVTSAEVDSLLTGGDTPTADELSARVARRKALSAAGAPPFLGDPPQPPAPMDGLPPSIIRVMSALGFTIQGILGEAEAPAGDEQMIIGIGGSSGTYEGPARLVRNFDDLWDVQEGDVLVTPATGESFNAFLHLVGAIVTDHGSFASHAAIMGREMGFPTVVGSVNATSRIPAGAIVRVDGGSGAVTIVSVPDA
jgi:phosphohistidine swiveling domain-containing protein